MEDEIESKEAGRKPAHGGWINRGLGKRERQESKHGDRQGVGRTTDRAGQSIGRACGEGSTRANHSGGPSLCIAEGPYRKARQGVVESGREKKEE